MQYADKLQEEITRLARLSGLDLRAAGTVYYLEKSWAYRLTILVRSRNRLEVHYRSGKENSATIEIFMLRHCWAPLRLHIPYRSPLAGAELNEGENGFIVSDIQRYEEIVKLCNLMAKEIHSRHFEDEEVKLTIVIPEKTES
jgi:hypothetical protein